MIYPAEADIISFLKNLVQALRPYAAANEVNLYFSSKIKEQKIKYVQKSAATVVAVSQGYPGAYNNGLAISLPQSFQTSIVFHAGTKMVLNELQTNGGRVLAVTSFGNTIKEAAALSNGLLENIAFDGMYYRNDIGYEFS